jgi:hypothetical protein
MIDRRKNTSVLVCGVCCYFVVFVRRLATVSPLLGSVRIVFFSREEINCKLCR